MNIFVYIFIFVDMLSRVSFIDVILAEFEPYFILFFLLMLLTSVFYCLMRIIFPMPDYDKLR